MVLANLVDNGICRYFCLNNLFYVVPFNRWVINTQVNDFVLEYRRTITDTDMMVLYNLVDNVICRYFFLLNCSYTLSGLLDKGD